MCACACACMYDYHIAVAYQAIWLRLKGVCICVRVYVRACVRVFVSESVACLKVISHALMVKTLQYLYLCHFAAFVCYVPALFMPHSL